MSSRRPLPFDDLIAAARGDIALIPGAYIRIEQTSDTNSSYLGLVSTPSSANGQIGRHHVISRHLEIQRCSKVCTFEALGSI